MNENEVIYSPWKASKDCSHWVNSGKSTAKWVVDVAKVREKLTYNKQTCSTGPRVNNGKYTPLICIRSKEGFSTPCVDIKQWIHYFIKYLLENITIWDNYMIYGYNYCSLEHISIFHKRDTDHILASMSIISVSWSRIVTVLHNDMPKFIDFPLDLP